MKAGNQVRVITGKNWVNKNRKNLIIRRQVGCGVVIAGAAPAIGFWVYIERDYPPS